MLSLLAGPLLPIGSVAPGFTLPDESGAPVALDALRGSDVILVFYPGDDTTICTRQLCALRDGWALVRARGTRVFGINPQEAPSHARFRAKYSLPFPLLIDKDRKVCALYHARGIWVKRTVYRIGADGIIRFARRGVPSVDDILGPSTPPGLAEKESKP